MPVFLIIVAVGLWFVFGHPGRNIADWFWPEDAAPWEKVDAFYYPDRGDLTLSINAYNVGGLDQCRSWVRAAASDRNDPSLERGDYECGVGYIGKEGSLNVYRLTVR